MQKTENQKVDLENETENSFDQNILAVMNIFKILSYESHWRLY